MKKRYVFCIIGIVTVMILSLVIYAAKIINNNESDFGLFILNKIYGINLNQINESEQNKMNNYLSQNSENSKNLNSPKNSICTTTGYEGLSNSSERLCYNLIKSQCNKISDEIYKSNLYTINTVKVSGSELSTTQIKKILYAIQNDNPDIFWISNTFEYYYSRNSTFIKLYSAFSKQEQQKAVEKLNNKVSEIISCIPKNSDEYETELFLHDYIIKNCTYEKDSSNLQSKPKVFNSYGCLVEGNAVCEGFSKSMQLLMNCVGIKCQLIMGARESEPHMWNVANINGDWYHVDVTWDGAGSFRKYDYFNVTDEVIKKDHKIYDELSKIKQAPEQETYNFKLPICTSTKENYYEKNSIRISNLNSADSNKLMINKLIASASSKKSYVYIKVDKNSNFETIKNQLFVEKPYKFFSYITAANKYISNGNKISNQQVNYVVNKNQNVLIIQLNYV